MENILEKSGEFLEREREEGYSEGWNDYMAREFARWCMERIIDNAITSVQQIDYGFETSFNKYYRRGIEDSIEAIKKLK